MKSSLGARGIFALMVAHCAGMLDMVALPVWIGALIQHYKFDPQQAGGLATLFLFGAVLASVVTARSFSRINRRWVTVVGFALAALCFGAVSKTQEYGLMAILHVGAGLSIGAALSATHGTMARGDNPHRLFAIVMGALGVFSVIFYAAAPKLIAANGGQTLFVIFAVVMLVAAVVSAVAFPSVEPKVSPSIASQSDNESSAETKPKIPLVVWFGIVGISAMGLVQAMTFSFLERAGSDSGYGMEAVAGVLIALGIVNLFPAPLAGFLQNKISSRWVMLLAPGIQAIITYTLMTAGSFMVYAVSASVFAAVIIFTHTFVFGVLARLDVSGRALAATPAMVMVGAGIGPIMGGVLVKEFGYVGIGIAAISVAVIATFCFSRVGSHLVNERT